MYCATVQYFGMYIFYEDRINRAPPPISPLLAQPWSTYGRTSDPGMFSLHYLKHLNEYRDDQFMWGENRGIS